MFARLSAGLLLSLVTSLAFAQETNEEPPYDWVLLYYMAYDNNLERCGRPILDMLKEGITSERVAVAVSADFRDTDGMKRYVLTQGGEEEWSNSQEGSAEEETLAQELAWVGRALPAKKYALVFLNHGGGQGEMSYDEHPGQEGGQNWLYPPEVAQVITRWRNEVAGEVELMFYQQCGKGSLANYHAMKDAARYVMGSQTVVGAPNHYYAPAVRYVCENPQVGGLELAQEITRRESAGMFTTYTTLDTARLQELPAQLDALLAPLLKAEALAMPQRSTTFRSCFDFGRGGLFFDGIALLEALYQANGLASEPLEAFRSWSGEKLVVNHRVSPRQEQRAGSWCGYSIFLPLAKELLERYQDYPLYQESQLDELWQRFLEQRHSPSAPPAGAPR